MPFINFAEDPVKCNVSKKDKAGKKYGVKVKIAMSYQVEQANKFEY